MSKKYVLFAVAHGTESIEFSAPYDILKRAGAEIVIAKVKDSENDGKCLCFKTAQGLEIKADCLIENTPEHDYSMIVCPGGLPNAETLGNNKNLVERLQKQKKDGKICAAICASPVMVFEKNGILDGHCGTGYPSMQSELKNQSRVKERVVVDGNIITSQGPCTAIEFGFTLCETLFGKDKAEELKKGMVFY